MYSSVYRQLVKGHGYTIMDLEKIESHIDFHPVLMGALKYIEAENIIIRPYEKKKTLKIGKYLLIQRIVPADLSARYYELRKRFTFAHLARKLSRLLTIKHDKSKFKQ